MKRARLAIEVNGEPMLTRPHRIRRPGGGVEGKPVTASPPPVQQHAHAVLLQGVGISEVFILGRPACAI